MTSSSDEYNKLLIDYNNLKVENNKLTIIIDDKSRIIATLNTRLDSNNNLLSSQIEFMRNETSSLTEEINSRDIIINDLNRKYNILVTNYEDSKFKNSQYSAVQETAFVKIDELEKKLNDVTEDRNIIKKKLNILQASNLSQLYNNLDNVKNQLSKSTDIITSLKTRISELEDLLSSENENFKSILEQREYEWNNTFKKQDDDWNVQLDKATKEIEDSYARYSTLCDDFKELSNTYEAAKTKYSSTNNTIHSLQTALFESQKQIERYEPAIRALQHKIAEQEEHRLLGHNECWEKDELEEIILVRDAQLESAAKSVELLVNSSDITQKHHEILRLRNEIEKLKFLLADKPIEALHLNLKDNDFLETLTLTSPTAFKNKQNLLNAASISNIITPSEKGLVYNTDGVFHPSAQIIYFFAQKIQLGFASFQTNIIDKIADLERKLKNLQWKISPSNSDLPISIQEKSEDNNVKDILISEVAELKNKINYMENDKEYFEKMMENELTYIMSRCKVFRNIVAKVTDYIKFSKQSDMSDDVEFVIEEIASYIPVELPAMETPQVIIKDFNTFREETSVTRRQVETLTSENKFLKQKLDKLEHNKDVEEEKLRRETNNEVKMLNKDNVTILEAIQAFVISMQKSFDFKVEIDNRDINVFTSSLKTALYASERAIFQAYEKVSSIEFESNEKITQLALENQEYLESNDLLKQELFNTSTLLEKQKEAYKNLQLEYLAKQDKWESHVCKNRNPSTTPLSPQLHSSRKSSIIATMDLPDFSANRSNFKHLPNNLTKSDAIINEAISSFAIKITSFSSNSSNTYASKINLLSPLLSKIDSERTNFVKNMEDFFKSLIVKAKSGSVDDDLMGTIFMEIITVNLNRDLCWRNRFEDTIVKLYKSFNDVSVHFECLSEKKEMLKVLEGKELEINSLMASNAKCMKDMFNISEKCTLLEKQFSSSDFTINELKAKLKERDIELTKLTGSNSKFFDDYFTLSSNYQKLESQYASILSQQDEKESKWNDDEKTWKLRYNELSSRFEDANYELDNVKQSFNMTNLQLLNDKIALEIEVENMKNSTSQQNQKLQIKVDTLEKNLIVLEHELLYDTLPFDEIKKCKTNLELSESDIENLTKLKSRITSLRKKLTSSETKIKNITDDLMRILNIFDFVYKQYNFNKEVVTLPADSINDIHIELTALVDILKDNNFEMSVSLSRDKL